MDNKVLLVLVDTLIKEAMSKIEAVQGPRGPRGIAGRDGADFRFEDHKESISLLIQDKISNLELTESQVESLRGPRGRDGKDFDFSEHLEDIRSILYDKFEQSRNELKLRFSDLDESEKEEIRGEKGTDGKDGKDFDFEEHSEKIVAALESVVQATSDRFKLKFSDLSEDEVERLRGPRGQRGKPGLDGKDFDFEEHSEDIAALVTSAVSHVKDDLKLKFRDLSEEEIDSLRLRFEHLTTEQVDKIRGPRGQRGKQGRDFHFEEHSEKIAETIAAAVEHVKEDLKLRFSQLTAEEKSELKLKFEELTVDEIEKLRGPRGQRGKPGEKGQDFIYEEHAAEIESLIHKHMPKFSDFTVEEKKQLRGRPGAIGPAGLNGVNGRDGKDGKDAPALARVDVDQDGQEIEFSFTLEDGTKVTSNSVTLPKGGVDRTYIVGGSSGGGGNGKSAYDIAVDNGFVGDEAAWLASLVGPAGVDGADGADGIDGTDGVGVPPGGTSGQVLAKSSATDYDTEWVDQTGGAASVEVLDEYDSVVTTLDSINFIGENVRVRPRTVMADWPTLSAISPSLLGYSPAGVTAVDVYVDDRTLKRNVIKHPTVYLGAAVYLDSSNVARNAIATSMSTSNVLGMVEELYGSRCSIRLGGECRVNFTALDVTEDYFLSDVVAGQITTSLPGSGNVRLRLGQATEETKFLFARGERSVL